MFAGISNYIWGTSSDQGAKSSQGEKENPGNNCKPNELLITDSGDESDSWVLVDESSKANKVFKNSDTTSDAQVSSSSNGKWTNNNTNKIKRPSTRVIISSSQVPIKLVPVGGSLELDSVTEVSDDANGYSQYEEEGFTNSRKKSREKKRKHKKER